MDLPNVSGYSLNGDARLAYYGTEYQHPEMRPCIIILHKDAAILQTLHAFWVSNRIPLGTLGRLMIYVGDNKIENVVRPIKFAPVYLCRLTEWHRYTPKEL